MRPLTQRQGQVWSSDFAISLFIFSAAALIAFTIILNTFDEKEYEDVRKQSIDAAAVLATAGYPEHWTAEDVIRAGVVSDGVLSMRKADELAQLPPADLKSALRVSDRIAIYATNATDVVGIFGTCGLGDEIPAAIANNTTLPAIAMGAAPVLSAAAGIPAPGDDALYNFTRNDVVIVEGALESDLADAEIMRLFDDAAERGITVVIIGDPGIPIMGLAGNSSNVSAVTALAGGELLGLATGEELTIDATAYAADPSRVTAHGDVRTYVPLASQDGLDVYASWIYKDAQVWYLATAAGTHANGTALSETFTDAIGQMITVSRPSCGNLTPPAAEQLAVHTRTISYHDQLLELHVLVWRDR